MAKSPKSSGSTPPAGDPAAKPAKGAAPKKAKLSTGKASKPELKPLDTYLADLLSPAVNRGARTRPVSPSGRRRALPMAT